MVKCMSVDYDWGILITGACLFTQEHQQIACLIYWENREFYSRLLLMNILRKSKEMMQILTFISKYLIDLAQ